MQRLLIVVAVAILLAPGLPGAATTDEQVKQLLKEYTAAFAAMNHPEAARACAAAMLLAPRNPAIENCSKSLSQSLPLITKAGAALLAGGDFERAWDWCRAALILGHNDAGTCTKDAGAQLTSRNKDQIKLLKARAFIDVGDLAQAGPVLTELLKSEITEIAAEAIKLQARVGRITSAQTDAVERAKMALADYQIADGKRETAATTLKEVMASKASAAVISGAQQKLTDSQTRWATVFVESLRTPWVLQVLAGLVIFGASWIGLHWIRNVYRWSLSLSRLRGRHRTWRWMFTGLSGEDTLGAREPILDALKRVPREVHKAIWTPTRLLLYPGQSGWEVWEDFAVAKATDQMHETFLTDLVLSDKNPDKALADAFQNLQFNVGSVAVSGIAQFWTGLVEWWRTGDPAISAAARESNSADASKQEVAIRLSASGGPGGTVSVVATTEKGDSGADAVTLSAERAAYKLLSRMGKHNDTADQIDGHAAFRQGATALSRYLHGVGDDQADKARREGHLTKVIRNLEFASQVFDRDGDHRKYFLEALRLQAIAYACLGRDAAAQTLLERLHDATSSASNARDRQLAIEAKYNLAMLASKQVQTSNGQRQVMSCLAGMLFAEVGASDDTLADACAVWLFKQFADFDRREWLDLKKETAQEKLDKVRRFLAQPASNVTVVDETKPTPEPRLLPQPEHTADVKLLPPATRDANTQVTADDKLPKESSGLRRWFGLRANAAPNDARVTEIKVHARERKEDNQSHTQLLNAHARRYYAVAQLRFMSTFELSSRGPFGISAATMSPEIVARVESCVDDLVKSGRVGPLAPGALTMCAYAKLMLSRWWEAEAGANEVLSKDKSDHFALYIAAEAALQRNDVVQARKYVSDVASIPIVDPALRDLITHLQTRPA